MRPAHRAPRLMLVTDRQRTRGRDLLDVVLDAADAGVPWVQLRERDLGEDRIRPLIERLLAELPPTTRLSLNGRPRLAAEYGVHLHLPAAHPQIAACGDLQAGPWFGRSVHDPERARLAVREGAAYVLVGTIFSSPSKPGLQGAGIVRIGDVRAAIGDLPLLAIGGIDETRVRETCRAGADGVAVCGAILEAARPGLAVRALLDVLAVSPGSHSP